jgi:hypothetical protein
MQKHCLITLVFDKYANFLAKIAENSYYNIDPRDGRFDRSLQRQLCPGTCKTRSKLASLGTYDEK